MKLSQVEPDHYFAEKALSEKNQIILAQRHAIVKRNFRVLSYVGLKGQMRIVSTSPNSIGVLTVLFLKTDK
ncbi:MAG: hypothetical protein GY759_01030 [Chloroflexi bacterium]|nr:hypothetical protein [Chloroflexota bacterium]